MAPSSPRRCHQRRLDRRRRPGGPRPPRALEKPAPVWRAPILGPFGPEAPAADHLAAVERTLAYIRAGDVYQVSLSRRLIAPVVSPGDPLAFLSALAPAPFGALVQTEAGTIVSNSPERFLRRGPGDDRVESRPIKGTRARGSDPETDRALAGALAASDKEGAEHLMIDRPLAERRRPHRRSRHGFRRGPCARGLASDRPSPGLDRRRPEPRPHRGSSPAAGSSSVGGGIVADSSPARELEQTEEKAAAFRTALRGR